MCFIPIRPGAKLDAQRYLELACSGHVPPHDLSDLCHRLGTHLEHELIVNLHDEPRRRILALAPGIDRDHGALDDVRGRPLHGSVNGTALGVLPHLGMT